MHAITPCVSYKDVFKPYSYSAIRLKKQVSSGRKVHYSAAVGWDTTPWEKMSAEYQTRVSTTEEASFTEPPGKQHCAVVTGTHSIGWPWMTIICRIFPGFVRNHRENMFSSQSMLVVLHYSRHAHYDSDT